ncbi:MAG: TspO/MBR family protein [Syntrophales bacterium]|jgi:tryptophan-rich sensory protein
MKGIRKNLHYILAPIFYFSVAQIGSSFTMQGVSTWYMAIMKPSYNPPGVIIGVVWTVIYILSAISLIVFVNAARGKKDLWVISGLYLLNGLINALWSYIFFVRHLLFLAFLDALFIWVTVGLLIIYIWSYSRISSMLLVPYFLWVSFATYLTFVIYRLN